MVDKDTFVWGIAAVVSVVFWLNCFAYLFALELLRTSSIRAVAHVAFWLLAAAYAFWLLYGPPK